MLLCFAALLAAYCTAPSAGETPSFDVELISGGKITQDEIRGKVTVLDFWGTWCAPCISEIPHYNRLQRKYKDQGLLVLGVAVQSGTKETLAKQIVQLKINYPVALGSQETMEAFGGVYSIPTTFLIDQDGRIQKVWTGAFSDKNRELDEMVQKLLNKTVS